MADPQLMKKKQDEEKMLKRLNEGMRKLNEEWHRLEYGEGPKEIMAKEDMKRRMKHVMDEWYPKDEGVDKAVSHCILMSQASGRSYVRSAKDMITKSSNLVLLIEITHLTVIILNSKINKPKLHKY